MENMISNEDIKKVASILRKEYEFSLTERQIKNISKRLEEYDFDTKEEMFLALIYSCRIKNEINNYISFNVHNNNLKKYYFCNTIDYAIDRALSVLYNKEVNHIYSDSNLEDNILFIDSSFRIEKNKKLTLNSNNK